MSHYMFRPDGKVVKTSNSGERQVIPSHLSAQDMMSVGDTYQHPGRAVYQIQRGGDVRIGAGGTQAR
jgi:hypothetical protein